jgi:cellulose synthase/poly-beta-1,6-N-acetylglucosamine synthase-like glycosyltransferase
MRLLFWIGFAWLAYVYVGYPVLVWIWSKLRPFRPAVDDNFVPTVSVLIAARNEEKDIEWKVRETLAWDYPADRLQALVASDASTDGTDEILAGIKDPRFSFVRMEPRSGKQVALNRLAGLASGDILFFTDANTHIGPAALRRMVSYFADAKVGCVTGPELNINEADGSATVSGERRYLGYESWINVAESRLGSVLICNGANFAMRRSLFTPLQREVANDLESPLRIGALGYALLFDPELQSTERASTSARQEFMRRRRICGQGILGMWRLWDCLHGLRRWQFLSRKFLRWFGLIPMTAVFFSSALLLDNGFAGLTFAMALLFVLFAIVGFLIESGGGRSWALFRYPFYFLLINVAAFVGVMETALGRRYGVWESAASTREDSAAATSSANDPQALAINKKGNAV